MPISAHNVAYLVFPPFTDCHYEWLTIISIFARTALRAWRHARAFIWLISEFRIAVIQTRGIWSALIDTIFKICWCFIHALSVRRITYLRIFAETKWMITVFTSTRTITKTRAWIYTSYIWSIERIFYVYITWIKGHAFSITEGVRAVISTLNKTFSAQAIADVTQILIPSQFYL